MCGCARRWLAGSAGRGCGDARLSFGYPDARGSGAARSMRGRTQATWQAADPRSLPCPWKCSVVATRVMLAACSLARSRLLLGRRAPSRLCRSQRARHGWHRARWLDRPRCRARDHLPSWAMVVMQPWLQVRRLSWGGGAQVQYYLYEVQLGAPPPLRAAPRSTSPRSQRAPLRAPGCSSVNELGTDLSRSQRVPDTDGTERVACVCLRPVVKARSDQLPSFFSEIGS